MENKTTTESRVKKTLLNARVNLVFYFLTLALSFFSRKIFLDCLGADFVGLTGTLQNLLGFLNLAELGIGSAIGYVLYKPLFERNQEKINEIISVMGYLYRCIGIMILSAGCVLACFLPLIFPDSTTGFDISLRLLAHRLFYQLPAKPAWSRPTQLCSHSIFPVSKYHQDPYPDVSCLLYAQLLSVGIDRASFRHHLFIYS